MYKFMQSQRSEDVADSALVSQPDYDKEREQWIFSVEYLSTLVASKPLLTASMV